MKFNNKQLKDWKDYHKVSKRITVKIHRNKDWKMSTYNFNSEEELNRWLDNYGFTLGDDEYIEEIIESDVYEFDYDKYSKFYEY